MTALLTTSYSITVRAKVPHHPGMFAQVALAIGDAGGSLGGLTSSRSRRGSRSATSHWRTCRRCMWLGGNAADRHEVRSSELPDGVVVSITRLNRPMTDEGKRG
jgi:hypothetical protein